MLCQMMIIYKILNKYNLSKMYDLLGKINNENN